MTGLFQPPARHVELLKLLIVDLEQSQLSEGKASLDGQRQGYTWSLGTPAKTNAGGTPVPAFRNLEYITVWVFSFIFDFFLQPDLWCPPRTH